MTKALAGQAPDQSALSRPIRDDRLHVTCQWDDMRRSGEPKTSREKVRAHRARLRRQGLRPIRIWVPDARSRTFLAQAHRQSGGRRRQRISRSGPGIRRFGIGPRPRMKRGEIWTVAGGTDYAGKPRPAVVIQDDRFDATGSITICVFTTDPTDAPLFRVAVDPTPANGLVVSSRAMVDKITTAFPMQEAVHLTTPRRRATTVPCPVARHG